MEQLAGGRQCGDYSHLGGTYSSSMSPETDGKARRPEQTSSTCSPTRLGSMRCGSHKLGVWLVLTTEGGAGSGEVGVADVKTNIWYMACSVVSHWSRVCPLA